MPPDELPPIADRYALERELGRGASAVVYLARDRVDDRLVAVKVLRRELTESTNAELFLREVQHTGRLRHEHIVALLDSGESADGRLYFVTPYFANGSLQDRLAREKPLPIDAAVAITRAIADALDHAHARGLIHRDVKPANILLDGDKACLADFGIARALDHAPGWTTSTGLIRGTPAYMSPEQASGERVLDGRSDVYSLGCVLYEMLAGVPPFVGPSAQSVMALRFRGPPRPVEQLRPVVSPALARVVARSLAVVPADRMPSAKRFEEELVEAMVKPPEPPNGYRLVAMIAGAVVLVAAGALAWRTGGLTASEEAGAPAGTLAVYVDSDGGRGSLGDAALTARVARALRAELAGWPEVRVADGKARKGRLGVEATAVPLGDSVRVIVDVRELDATIRRLARIVSRNEIEAAGTLSPLVRAILAGTDADIAPNLELMPGRSLSALRSYVTGWRELRAGRLDTAAVRFRSALRDSPQFGHAALWAAQSAAWSRPRDTLSWVDAAEAAGRAGTLTGADAALAEALRALGRHDYPAACVHFRAATTRDPASFAGWYGLGECARLDPVVVRTSLGPRFRSSAWAAIRAYREAVERSPTPELFAALSGRVMYSTYAAGNHVRLGRLGGTGGEPFAALPSVVADTLAFYPISLVESQRSGARAVPATYLAALRRARATALDLTARWVRYAPGSSEAWLQRALALELVGHTAPGPADTSAVGALDRCAAGARTDLERARIAVARSRLALRRGDFSTAAGVARAALVGRAPADVETRRALAPLAALIGDTSLAEELITFEHDSSDGLPVALLDSLRRFRARAVVGACEGLEASRRALEARVSLHFAPAELARQRQRLLQPAYRDAIPCLGPSILVEFAPAGPLDQVYRALADGDHAAARAILATVRGRRAGATVAAVTWDFLYAESWASMRANDMASARAQLLMALADIADINLNTLDEPAQAAGFRRGVTLLRHIAPGDAAAAVWLSRADALTPFTRDSRG